MSYGTFFHFLYTPCSSLRGVGSFYTQRLKNLGIKTFWDLLCYFPIQYRQHHHHYQEIAKNPENPKETWVRCPIFLERRSQWISSQKKTIWYFHGKMLPNPIDFHKINTASTWKDPLCQSLPCVLMFFQRPYRFFSLNTWWWVQGMVKKMPNGTLMFTHPRVEDFAKTDLMNVAPPFSEKSTDFRASPGNVIAPGPSLQSLYRCEKQIPSKKISLWISSILDEWKKNHDHWDFPHAFSMVYQNFFKQWWKGQNIPLENANTFPSLYQSFLALHFPQALEVPLDLPKEKNPWYARLAFDEWLMHHMAFSRIKRYQSAYSIHPGSTPFVEKILKEFGHALTPSQQESWNILQGHLGKKTPMIHFLQGDVGSGKSIVGFLSLALAADSGYYACLLAPTETLIRQHFQALASWIPTRLILAHGHEMGDPKAHIILGTHALFFQDFLSNLPLALVVIDEQQRFGVLQRLHLLRQNSPQGAQNLSSPTPHMLTLSATPIPRTLQKILRQDITWSRLNLRANHPGIATHVIEETSKKDLEQWIYRTINQRQGVYWVCSAIEGDGGVLQRYEKWKAHIEKFWPSPCSAHIGYLHGRLSSIEKNKIMEAFRKGDIRFLISTSVIEVGIDVPEASGIIIENPENFGLAQLHQLRGRVGRGEHPGHCFLLISREISKNNREKLDFFTQCQDGLHLAQYDLKHRGGGNLCGVNQSGFTLGKFLDLSFLQNHQHIFENFLHDRPALEKTMNPVDPQIFQALLALFQCPVQDGLHAG